MEKGKEINIHPGTIIEEIQGKYAWSDNWDTGGIIGYGDERGVSLPVLEARSLYPAATFFGLAVK